MINPSTLLLPRACCISMLLLCLAFTTCNSSRSPTDVSTNTSPPSKITHVSDPSSDAAQIIKTKDASSGRSKSRRSRVGQDNNIPHPTLDDCLISSKHWQVPPAQKERPVVVVLSSERHWRCQYRLRVDVSDTLNLIQLTLNTFTTSADMRDSSSADKVLQQQEQREIHSSSNNITSISKDNISTKHTIPTTTTATENSSIVNETQVDIGRNDTKQGSEDSNELVSPKASDQNENGIHSLDVEENHLPSELWKDTIDTNRKHIDLKLKTLRDYRDRFRSNSTPRKGHSSTGAAPGTCVVKLIIQEAEVTGSKPAAVVCLEDSISTRVVESLVYHYHSDIQVTLQWDPFQVLYLSMGYSMVPEDVIPCKHWCDAQTLCVLEGQVCNGFQNCADGSDEDKNRCQLFSSTQHSAVFSNISQVGKVDVSTSGQQLEVFKSSEDNSHMVIIGVSIGVCIGVLMLIPTAFMIHFKCRASLRQQQNSLLQQQQHTHSLSSEMYQSPSGSVQDSGSQQYDQQASLLQEQQLEHNHHQHHKKQKYHQDSHHHQQHIQQQEESPILQHQASFQNRQHSLHLSGLEELATPSFTSNTNIQSSSLPERSVLSTPGNECIISQQPSRRVNLRHEKELRHQSYPHHIPISGDGEEGYLASQKALRQHPFSLVHQQDIRPPPNKTVFDRASPPPPYSSKPLETKSLDSILPTKHSVGGNSGGYHLRTGQFYQSSNSTNNKNNIYSKSKRQEVSPSPPLQPSSQIPRCHSMLCHRPESIHHGCPMRYAAAAAPPPEYHQVASAFPPNIPPLQPSYSHGGCSGGRCPSQGNVAAAMCKQDVCPIVSTTSHNSSSSSRSTSSSSSSSSSFAVVNNTLSHHSPSKNCQPVSPSSPNTLAYSLSQPVVPSTSNNTSIPSQSSNTPSYIQKVFSPPPNNNSSSNTFDIPHLTPSSSNTYHSPSHFNHSQSVVANTINPPTHSLPPQFPPPGACNSLPTVSDSSNVFTFTKSSPSVGPCPKGTVLASLNPQHTDIHNTINTNTQRQDSTSISPHSTFPIPSTQHPTSPPPPYPSQPLTYSPPNPLPIPNCTSPVPTHSSSQSKIKVPLTHSPSAPPFAETLLGDSTTMVPVTMPKMGCGQGELSSHITAQDSITTTVNKENECRKDDVAAAVNCPSGCQRVCKEQSASIYSPYSNTCNNDNSDKSSRVVTHKGASTSLLDNVIVSSLANCSSGSSCSDGGVDISSTNTTTTKNAQDDTAAYTTSLPTTAIYNFPPSSPHQQAYPLAHQYHHHHHHHPPPAPATALSLSAQDCVVQAVSKMSLSIPSHPSESLPSPSPSPSSSTVALITPSPSPSSPTYVQSPGIQAFHNSKGDHSNSDFKIENNGNVFHKAVEHEPADKMSKSSWDSNGNTASFSISVNGGSSSGSPHTVGDTTTCLVLALDNNGTNTNNRLCDSNNSNDMCVCVTCCKSSDNVCGDNYTS